MYHHRYSTRGVGIYSEYLFVCGFLRNSDGPPASAQPDVVPGTAGTFHSSRISATRNNTHAEFYLQPVSAIRGGFVDEANTGYAQVNRRFRTVVGVKRLAQNIMGEPEIPTHFLFFANHTEKPSIARSSERLLGGTTQLTYPTKRGTWRRSLAQRLHHYPVSSHLDGGIPATNSEGGKTAGLASLRSMKKAPEPMHGITRTTTTPQISRKRLRNGEETP